MSTLKQKITQLLPTAALVCLCTILCACNNNTPTPTFGKVQELAADGPVRNLRPLEQNWDMATREKFWFTSQGSRFIPYTWFASLEQPDNATLFRNTEHMSTLRYIPVASSSCKTEELGRVPACNPSGLPIGFALDIDKKNGDAWLGFTCAACHSAQINIGGDAFIIEGGPTMGNFNLFYERLIAASEATLKPENSDKFERFAKRVLTEDYSEDLAKSLYKDLEIFSENLARRQKMNTASDEFPHDFIGYGRVDAFGIIKNAATSLALDDPTNINPVNAPVSYPFLWGTNQSDVVQWNGALPNTNFLGPLARNAGEVIGSFGGLKIRPAPWWRRWFLRQKNTYSSNVNIENLGYLESSLRDLRSPMLAELMPELSLVDTTKGAAIYQQNCQSCHALVSRESQGDPYKAVMIRSGVVGTDEVMTKNATDQVARTGPLEGVRLAIYFREKLGPVEPAIKFAFNGTFGIMLNNPITTYRAAKLSQRETEKDNSAPPPLPAAVDNEAAEGFLRDQFNEYIEDYLDSACDLPADGINPAPDPRADASYCYKARPLTGIWATAPYLHNGSVPSLRDLLRAEDDRPTQFWLGNLQYDAQNIGHVSSEGLAQYNVFYEDGITPIKGNSNRGHTYGTGLSTEEKDALLAFLRTL